jgi:hypothetical protein
MKRPVGGIAFRIAVARERLVVHHSDFEACSLPR